MNASTPVASYTRPVPVQSEVVSLRFWTKSLLSLRIKRPPGFVFEPGQFARLGLPASRDAVEAGKEVQWRAFSIVSSREDGELEFYAVLVPGGAFSTMLEKLGEGDVVWVENRAQGFLTTECFKDGKALWMLATGTGVGPFISILQETGIWQRFDDLVLVHCVRHAQELSYHDQLEALREAPGYKDSRARLHLVETVTRDPADMIPHRCLHGRITHLLQNGDLEKSTGLLLGPEDSRVMLCGNPDMIAETRKLLAERGFKPCRRHTPGQFLTENYW